MRLRSQNEHRIPHTDGSRDANVESDAFSSLFVKSRAPLVAFIAFL